MGFNSGFKGLIYSTLGQKSESVVAAVQTAKEVRIHHSNSPVTSSDVRHYTDRVCQHATSMYTVYMYLHRHARIQAAWQGVRLYTLATALRRSNPDGGEIFSARPDRPYGLPDLLYNGYRVSFLGVKRPGA